MCESQSSVTRTWGAHSSSLGLVGGLRGRLGNGFHTQQTRNKLLECHTRPHLLTALRGQGGGAPRLQSQSSERDQHRETLILPSQWGQIPYIYQNIPLYHTQSLLKYRHDTLYPISIKLPLEKIFKCLGRWGSASETWRGQPHSTTESVSVWLAGSST